MSDIGNFAGHPFRALVLKKPGFLISVIEHMVSVDTDRLLLSNGPADIQLDGVSPET